MTLERVYGPYTVNSMDGKAMQKMGVGLRIGALF